MKKKKKRMKVKELRTLSIRRFTEFWINYFELLEPLESKCVACSLKRFKFYCMLKHLRTGNFLKKSFYLVLIMNFMTLKLKKSMYNQTDFSK